MSLRDESRRHEAVQLLVQASRALEEPDRITNTNVKAVAVSAADEEARRLIQAALNNLGPGGRV